MGLQSLRITAMLGVLLAGTSQTLGAQPAASGAQPLSGSWSGVYQAYPHLIKMTMQIPSPGRGQTETDLRVEPLVESRSVGRAHMGVVRVTVDYDPVARTFSITPAPSAARGAGFTAPRFSGVFDDARSMLAGVIVDAPPNASPYFVMARADAAEDAFLDTLRSTLEESGRPTRNNRSLRLGNLRLGGRGDSPGQAKLLEWTRPLVTEYADTNLYRTEMGRLFGMARHLFRDEHFKPYFGKTYDELSRADREAVIADIRKIQPPRANFPEERANGAVRALESAFRASGTGTYAAPDLTLSVIALRTIHAWRSRSLAWLGSAPAVLDTLTGIGATEAAEAQVLGTGWPSERSAFTAAVAASRVRVAGPVLAQSVDNLLRKATSFVAISEIRAVLDSVPVIPPAGTARTANRAASPRGRRTMANPSGAPPAPTSVPALMALVPAEVRQPHITRLERRIDELVATEARGDAEALTRFGSGLEALRTSGQWEDGIAAKYRGLSERPSVQSLLTTLAERRAPLLDAAEATLTARLRAARTSADLGQVRDTYLSVPSDIGHPAGARLYQLALERDAQLRSTELAKAAQEAQKRREEASPCASASNARSLHEDAAEPTARDMCLAYERLLVGTQEGLKEMQSDCRGLNSNSNPLLAINCLASMAGGMGGGPQLSLRNFEKLECFRGSGETFRCNFAADLSSANPMFGPIVNRASGEVITGYFTRRDSTWIFRRR